MSSTSTKSFKAVADDVKPTGEVVAMVSPFGGQPDLQGDVIDEHAYDAAIKFWNGNNRTLPVLDSHDWSTVDSDLGYVETLEAVPGYGLVAKMRLDLSNPRAAYAHKLMQERRRVEFSIGYSLPESEPQKDGSTLLKKINLREISLVLAGAAADRGAPVGRTELLGVKSDDGEKAASEDVARLRHHLHTGHSVAAVLPGKTMRELQTMHALAHADVPATPAHVASGDPEKSDDESAEFKRLSKEREERRAAEIFARRELALYKEAIAEAEALPQGAKSEQPDRVDAFVESLRAERRQEALVDTTAAPSAGSPNDFHDSRFAREQRLEERERANDEVVGGGFDTLWQREEELARQERARDEVVAVAEVPQP
jgi:HK97 family phage prohead protease